MCYATHVQSIKSDLTYVVTAALQEKNMEVKPDYGYDTYVGHNKLKDKVLTSYISMLLPVHSA